MRTTRNPRRMKLALAASLAATLTLAACGGDDGGGDAGDDDGATGSRVVSHRGQLPGEDWQTSGCIGQTCILPSCAGAASAEDVAGWVTPACACSGCSGASDTGRPASSFNDAGGSRPCSRYQPSGSACNAATIFGRVSRSE